MGGLQRTRHGFTIVELLIVIVVIGVLAAITVVAYNGITGRAENTKTISAASAFAKSISLYKTTNQLYPSVTNACVGPTGTTCSNVSDSTGACGGLGAAAYKSALETAVQTQVAALPTPSTQRIPCGGKEYGGILYHSPDSGSSAQLRTFLRGDVTCDPLPTQASSAKTQIDSLTICTYTFSANS
jgi:general secretion pathway protein G